MARSPELMLMTWAGRGHARRAKQSARLIASGGEPRAAPWRGAGGRGDAPGGGSRARVSARQEGRLLGSAQSRTAGSDVEDAGHRQDGDGEKNSGDAGDFRDRE